MRYQQHIIRPPRVEGMVPCISIKQPWCWVIMHPELLQAADVPPKDLENRGWFPECPVDVVIRAGGFDTGFFQRKRLVEENTIAIFARLIGVPLAKQLYAIMPKPKDDYPSGGIVGRCTIANVLPKFDRFDHPWKVYSEYGLVLTNIQDLPFTQVSGDFMLFNIPETLFQPRCQ